MDGTLIHHRLALSRRWYSFTYPGRMESWVSLGEKKVGRIFKSRHSWGFEPVTSVILVSSIHCLPTEVRRHNLKSRSFLRGRTIDSHNNQHVRCVSRKMFFKIKMRLLSLQILDYIAYSFLNLSVTSLFSPYNWSSSWPRSPEYFKIQSTEVRWRL